MSQWAESSGGSRASRRIQHGGISRSAAMATDAVGEETGLPLIVCPHCRMARVIENRTRKDNHNHGRIYFKCPRNAFPKMCGYYRFEKAYVKQLKTLGIIQDKKLQDVLGHFQKDFEGDVSAENLGSKFGGYGSFLPTYQRSPLPQTRRPPKAANVASRSPFHQSSEIASVELQGSQEVPEVMSLELLRTITNNFSEEQKLGGGTFGTVYKGLHRGKEIAVKWLHLMPQRLDYEEEFMKEFENLRRLKHPNIVQLLGYCYEIKRVCVEHEGRYVMADDIHRALCFEYMCNGSLQRHLDDEVHRLDWWACYKIIKGTCEGLKYLHEAKMYHLDLKPGNILLDMNMVPKIADFGLSRLVHDSETHATSSLLGTNRYCPPEYINHKYISNKFDIFSLGVVMIEIIAGREGYCKAAEIPSQEFIDHVQEIWRKRLQATAGCISLIYECRQVKRCTEIALLCVSSDRKKRPSIGDITHWLEDIENNVEKLATNTFTS